MGLKRKSKEEEKGMTNYEIISGFVNEQLKDMWSIANSAAVGYTGSDSINDLTEEASSMVICIGQRCRDAVLYERAVGKITSSEATEIIRRI